MTNISDISGKQKRTENDEDYIIIYGNFTVEMLL